MLELLVRITYQAEQTKKAFALGPGRLENHASDTVFGQAGALRAVAIQSSGELRELGSERLQGRARVAALNTIAGRWSLGDRPSRF